jgi:hypothetical protein
MTPDGRPETDDEREQVERATRRANLVLSSLNSRFRWLWYWFGLPLWVRIPLQLVYRVVPPILIGVGIGHIFRFGI